MSNCNAQFGSVKILWLICLWSIISIFPPWKIVLAQSSSDNPLLEEIDKGDRLIPSGYGRRELTSFEKYRIKEAISELDRAADVELKQGNEDRAFELWYRRLKLTRAIGTIEEIEALGNIGAIAWTENRGTDVRNVAERLIAIEQELTAQKLLSTPLLNKLGVAYQQVRYLDKATKIYQQILADRRTQDLTRPKNLETLGKLYLARFDYRQAADIYQELLTLSDRDESKQFIYLERLADIYERTTQTDRAIAIKQRLIQQYGDTRSDKIVDWEIAIARDYETLDRIDEAIQAYSRALDLASKAQKFATASDILARLGKLYRESERIDKAIATYDKLLEIQQQSYNYYGLLDTYDTLGKIYLNSDKTKARQYFQQGLELAKSLNYQVEYFNDAIERVNSK